MKINPLDIYEDLCACMFQDYYEENVIISYIAKHEYDELSSLFAISPMRVYKFTTFTIKWQFEDIHGELSGKVYEMSKMYVQIVEFLNSITSKPWLKDYTISKPLKIT